MPSEYETLVAALKLMDIPFQEYGWKTRPEGAYGIVSLDMPAGNMNGDDGRADRAWGGSVDVFYPKLTDRTDITEAVEEILAEVCGSSWELNSIQYEHSTGLFHVEWAFECMDTETPADPAEPGTEEPGTGGQDDPDAEEAGGP